MKTVNISYRTQGLCWRNPIFTHDDKDVNLKQVNNKCNRVKERR